MLEHYGSLIMGLVSRPLGFVELSPSPTFVINMIRGKTSKNPEVCFQKLREYPLGAKINSIALKT